VVPADRRHPSTTTQETLINQDAGLKTLIRIMELELAGSTNTPGK